MGIGTGSDQSTFIRWKGSQGEHASNPLCRRQGVGATAQTMISRVPASRRADFEHLAVIASLQRDAKLTAAVEPCHDRHHAHDRLAPALLERGFDAFLLPELDQVAR